MVVYGPSHELHGRKLLTGEQFKLGRLPLESCYRSSSAASCTSLGISTMTVSSVRSSEISFKVTRKRVSHPDDRCQIFDPKRQVQIAQR